MYSSNELANPQTTKIAFKENGEWKRGDVISRARKVASRKGKGKEGVYEHFWTIKDNDSGLTSVYDSRNFEEIETIPEYEDEVTFAVNIPWIRHNEPKCKQAKLQELDHFEEFDAYEEVKDKEQRVLGTAWVITEKVKSGETFVKASLL